MRPLVMLVVTLALLGVVAALPFREFEVDEPLNDTPDEEGALGEESDGPGEDDEPLEVTPDEVTPDEEGALGEESDGLVEDDEPLDETADEERRLGEFEADEPLGEFDACSWPCCDNCGSCNKKHPPEGQCNDSSVHGCHPECKKCVKVGARIPPGEGLGPVVTYRCGDTLKNFCKLRCTPAPPPPDAA